MDTSNGQVKKLDSSKTIGTHNGTFHCDEVLACFLLRQLPEYHNAKVIRSRDSVVLDACDIVVDVGGVFNPSSRRFDHHQRTFSHTFNSLRPDKPWNIKLSSAGLIYVHFGEEILAQMSGLTQKDPFVLKIYDLLYETFVMEIDAIDNGVAAADSLLYRVHTGISARVGHLNPWWNQSDSDENERFEKAVTLVGSEFRDKVNYYQNCWWPARSQVREAILKRHSVDPSGKILCLGESGGLPWKGHLWDLEKDMEIVGEILFVLYSDLNGNWRVQTVPPDELRPFENRLPLPESWRGVRDAELSTVTGIPDCVFVHASGFIGGNKTFSGALEMAKKTIAGPC